MVPLEVLKTSLFGYQKSGVEKYVARMKDEFNDRLIRDEMEHEKKLAQLQEQMDALREEYEAKLAEQEVQFRGREEQMERRLSDAEREKRDLSAEVERLLPARAQSEQYRAGLEELRGRINRILEQDKESLSTRSTPRKIYEFEAQ